MQIIFRKTKRSSRGQNFVEFALVTPIVLLAIVGGMDLGKSISIKHRVISAGYESIKFISQLSGFFSFAGCPQTQEERGNADEPPRPDQEDDNDTIPIDATIPILCEVVTARAKTALEAANLNSTNAEIRFIDDIKIKGANYERYVGIEISYPYTFISSSLSGGIIATHAKSKLTTYFGYQKISGENIDRDQWCYYGRIYNNREGKLTDAICD